MSERLFIIFGNTLSVITTILIIGASTFFITVFSDDPTNSPSYFFLLFFSYLIVLVVFTRFSIFYSHSDKFKKWQLLWAYSPFILNIIAIILFFQ
ncbi:MAG: hypothetical protein UR90_C0029G0006 [Parcubacteria group bacterium GW2011_GWC1_35_8]|uniref:Uncharacterized protein n=3 Tax=Candidatus Nomuraibacteriota TaxID=1752729 RepID=A0A1F6YRC1_9BACT|nr:MAG: hypothetical protein UR90_C0029G0006 [Parcubacteria group bacterium GW2011_GWC1_35_8]KKP87852.1 MAG: hypothetical protein UR91_C0034G0013 [Candidatus Nomurabacteria bacterium GW2011_GWC2_35_8]OGJ05562.1 MAG: hypothetical protein A2192_02330 [Candidatus Nomurabacteria bacterium RIFOXYA1_FULL_35_17]OGJ06004.1 MAG: hypothetical protein A2238_03085 [Candidatus Nomurabacteria bacterium RIFOXYA2_FULL_35_9]OGJ08913.1 MAG: hypothetical protein A2456_01085 [Candidatus Nomurabacteria bacterium RI